MTEDEDKLVMQFFEENAHEIEDNGFSDKVMSRLPSERANRLERLWTLFCTVVGVVLFFLVDGFKGLQTAFNNLFGDMLGSISSIDFSNITPMMAFLTLFIICGVGAYNRATAK